MVGSTSTFGRMDEARPTGMKGTKIIKKCLQLVLYAVCALAGAAPGVAQSNYERYPFSTLAGVAGGPGSADGTGIAARFNLPSGVAVDTARNVYVADYNNHTIRKITPEGSVSTLAGSPGMPGSVDGTGSNARFRTPIGVAVDPIGNVYVADSNNITIRKVTPDRVVTTLAGSVGQPGSADGIGAAALFRSPNQLAVDSLGNLYVADMDNNTIRKITPAAVVTTFAGSAGQAGSADGTGNAARFTRPAGVAVDSEDNLYVADTYNHTIRKITPARVVTTLAGLAGTTGYADGSGSAARFDHPYGVGLDPAGNVYVVNSYNHTIRKVTPAGVVTTLAGLPGQAGSSDGTGSAARFFLPSGMAVDAQGYVYVGDSWNHTIRIGGPAALSQLLNISTRLRVETDNNVLIAGFIVTGTVGKRVLIRALGPSLSGFVQGFLLDPTLELYDPNGALFASNDNWRAAFNAPDIQATGIPPSNDLESAILATLPPGQGYTAVVRGNASATGIAIVEVYNLNHNVDSVLANISTRGLVQTAENVIIGGFILGGNNGTCKVLIRAIGPSLSPSLSVPLADPTLRLHDGNGNIVAANDNWRDDPNQAAEITATGIPPNNDFESAMVQTLPAGNYTSIVAGRSDGTGVALVEVYNLQ
jgi:sugar lactone lactonase YvrE